MVAIAQGICVRPTVLMIDEFSLGLAPAVVGTLIEAVQALNAAGITVVLVEQSLNIVAQLTDRVVYMDQGQIVHDGSVTDLLNRPDLIRPVLLGAGRGARLRRGRGSEDAAVRVTGLSASRGPVRVLSDVSVEVAPGEVLGIIGSNGAGKTTLFDAISGFLPATGTIEIGGRDVTALPAHRRAEAGLARAFQAARLFDTLTVTETIAVACHRRGAGGATAAALWLPGVRRAERQISERVTDLLGVLGLTRYADHRIEDLSTGTRRAVEIACQMAADPTMLLLDEPSSGLAQAEVEALGPTLTRIGAQTGCGIAIIEHDLPLLTRICTRLLALQRGRVIADGAVEAVLTDPAVAPYLAGPATVTRMTAIPVGDASRGAL